MECSHRKGAANFTQDGGAITTNRTRIAWLPGDADGRSRAAWVFTRDRTGLSGFSGGLG